mmetsp:Transcript_12024/g.23927  ORF Transcript_12024/g.23927 Transcript_12024/m.23927 type:complete len:80 (-) Transcript_12024:46-285(-)
MVGGLNLYASHIQFLIRVNWAVTFTAAINNAVGKYTNQQHNASDGATNSTRLEIQELSVSRSFLRLCYLFSGKRQSYSR